MRILVIKGDSHYGGTRLFAEEAAAAFGRRRFQCELIDVAGGATAILEDMAGAGKFDLVLTFNILGEFRTSSGRTVSELFDCPHLVWYTDYILTSWPRLVATPSCTRLLVVDPTQIGALEAAFGPDRFETVRFFPHPAVGTPVPDEPDAEAFVAARPIPMLWSGSFNKPSRPWATAPPATQRLLDDAVDLALSVEWIPPHEAVATSLAARGVDVADPAHRGTLSAAPLVDAEVRQKRRYDFVMALGKSGAPLHICGDGWEKHLYRFKGATYHGAVEMTRTVELMRQARVVLNTNGNFGAGTHERPFSASLAGAAVFSDVSRYYVAEFQPGENIELFSWLDLPGAMDQLRSLVADPERCLRYARSAKQLTLAAHTWDRRIDHLLSAARLDSLAGRA